jgi:hypothetical protein
MIPYLSAILGARKIEAWGHPPMGINKIIKPGPLIKNK